jgi:hypothetical protein
MMEHLIHDDQGDTKPAELKNGRKWKGEWAGGSAEEAMQVVRVAVGQGSRIQHQVWIPSARKVLRVGGCDRNGEEELSLEIKSRNREPRRHLGCDWIKVCA